MNKFTIHTLFCMEWFIWVSTVLSLEADFIKWHFNSKSVKYDIYNEIYENK